MEADDSLRESILETYLGLCLEVGHPSTQVRLTGVYSWDGPRQRETPGHPTFTKRHVCSFPRGFCSETKQEVSPFRGTEE